MTEQELNDVRVGFAYIADAYAQSTLPEDDGMWELIVPSDGCDFTVTDILYYYENSQEAMPESVSQALGLPTDATYAEGAKLIWEDRSHRVPAPRRVLTPEDAARARTEQAAREAAYPDDAAWFRHLAEMDGGPMGQPSSEPSDQKPDWRRVGF